MHARAGLARHSRRAKALKAPFDGGRFENPIPKSDARGRAAFWKWQFTRKRGFWPDRIDDVKPAIPPERVEGAELRVTSVGHVTFLIQTAGLNILTDPLWSERASPFAWVGPKRVRKPGIDFNELPPIDLVLVSHNHYDHLDVVTLKRLYLHHRPRIVTPLGNARIMGLPPEAHVDEVDWDDTVAIGNHARVTATPLQHWSARNLRDRNKALWAGFVIDVPGGTIFFAGDTGYGEWWIEAARAAAPDLRLALLPIGAYQPRWFMKEAHMNPEEAVEAFKRLGARHALAMHFGVFPLADDAFDEPERAFRQVAPENFRLLLPGESWVL